MVSDEDYMACRAELDATRERRDECEVKMFKAFERVTAAETKLTKAEEECKSLRGIIEELRNASNAEVTGKDDRIAELEARYHRLERAVERVCSSDEITAIEQIVRDGTKKDVIERLRELYGKEGK